MLIETIILLAGLAIAIGSSWFFLNWKSPTKKQYLTQLGKQATENKDFKLEKFDQVASLKSEAETFISDIDENTTDEKEKAQLTCANEIKVVCEAIKSEEDLAKSYYSYLNIAYSVGLGLIVWVVIQWVGKMLVGTVKEE